MSSINFPRTRFTHDWVSTSALIYYLNCFIGVDSVIANIRGMVNCDGGWWWDLSTAAEAKSEIPYSLTGILVDW